MCCACLVSLVDLLGQNWAHGRCLVAFFSYLYTHKNEFDPNIEVSGDKTNPGCFGIALVSLLRFYVKVGILAPVERRYYVDVFNSFLQRLLPSPTDALHITGDSSCMRCKQKGGLQVKCKNASCGFYYHPLCYEETSHPASIASVVANNEIACPLHTERSIPRKPFGGKAPRGPAPKKEVAPANPDIQKAASILASKSTAQPSLADDAKSLVSVDDDGEVCDICHEGYSEPGDMLVFCDKCNIAVHQGCYGISVVPDGDWMCSVCAHGLSPSNVKCFICKQPGGAMRRTPEGCYIHLVCALYTPELSLNFNQPEVLIEGIHRISRERAELVCCICGQRGYGCVQCSSRSCSTSFHPYCALKAGYLLTTDEKNGVFLYLCYCQEHTEKKRLKQAGRSGTSSVGEVTPKKKRRQRKKKEKEKAKTPSSAIPDTMLQKWGFGGYVMRRIKVDEKQNQLWCVDFWEIVKYFYVMQPSPTPLISRLHFYQSLAFSLPPIVMMNSAIMPLEIINYVASVLKTDFTHFTPAALVPLLKKDPLFVVPALGTHKAELVVSAPTEERMRAVASAPHTTTNASFQRKQKLNFQGFDINDFADLRESYVCNLDYGFIVWAREHGVCKNTSFRIACASDIPWLLQINTINPTFSSQADYSGTFYEKNEFVILAERKNELGATVPVAMVHFYLMWYYPCTAKQREAVRAVYVCTLQRVSPSTHPTFCARHHVAAEPLTGTILLCLAFLQGRSCQMSMGCCDSTDNSVTFYTEQFGMTALPRGEGRHYTPMQIRLSSFDPRNILVKHMPSAYHGTLLCRLTAPSAQAPDASLPVLHLRISETGALQSAERVASKEDVATHAYFAHHYPQLCAAPPCTPEHPTTSLGHVCSRDDDGRWVYFTHDIPHFYEFSDADRLLSSEPDCCIDYSVYKSDKPGGRFIDSNEVERELEAAQDELFQTMNANEKGICCLLASMLNHEKETEETTRLVSECNRMAEELKTYEAEKRPDLVREEEEEENDAICEVCGDGDSNYGNVIIFCDGCNAAVHQCCYDLAELPKGDWFCNVCEDILVSRLGVRDVTSVTPKKDDKETDEASVATEMESEASVCQILDRLHEIRSRVYCCICGYSKGAMMRTNVKGVYAHVACALWHPCCRVTNALPCCKKEMMVPANEEEKKAYVESILKEYKRNRDAVVVSAASGGVTSASGDVTSVSGGVTSASETTKQGSSQEDTVLIPVNPQGQPGDVTSSNRPSEQPAASDAVTPEAIVTPETAVTPETTVTPEPTVTPSHPSEQAATAAPTTATTATTEATTITAKTEAAPITVATLLTPIPDTTPTLSPLLVPYHSPYDRLRADTELPRYCIDVSKLSTQRRSLICQLCGRKGGVVPCCCSGCNRGVHASCALKYELEMFWNNKIGHTSVPVEEVLVEKDFFLHCFHHSGGFQGRGLPRKHCDDYLPPFNEKEGRKKKRNDDYVDVEPSPVKRRQRRPVVEKLTASQQQGLERMRRKREKRKERERNRTNASRGRPHAAENALVFTTKPHTQKERRQRIVLEWLKSSLCAPYLMDDKENLLLAIQSQIDSHQLPVYEDWHGYNVDNGTLQSLFRRCKKRGFFKVEDLVVEIREMYLGLLSYCYPSLDPKKQAIAKLVCEDASELTKVMMSIDNPAFLVNYLKSEVYCVCMTHDGSSEFMVGCDACGLWFHPFCIGFAETKYYGFLTTYDNKYIDVRADSGCFFCPMCYEGENAQKMRLFTEEEVIATGAAKVAHYHENDVLSAMDVEETPIASEPKMEEGTVETLVDSEPKPEEGAVETKGIQREPSEELFEREEKRPRLE